MTNCKECMYYHADNNTCQLKKCATGGIGKVSIIDKIFCKPCSLLPIKAVEEYENDKDTDKEKAE